MASAAADAVEVDENEEQEVDIEFAIMLVKHKGSLHMKNVEGLPAPETIDDLYKELVLLVRNIEAEHGAMVHAEKMMQAAMAAQGVQQSGIVTPPGVKV